VIFFIYDVEHPPVRQYRFNVRAYAHGITYRYNFPTQITVGALTETKMFDCLGACLTLDALFRVRDI